MFLFHTKAPAKFPSEEGIKDPSVKRFIIDLSGVLIRTVRDLLDDLKQVEKVERITSLPTATLDTRGKFYLLQGTGGASDSLYLGIDTGGATYILKKVF